MGARWKLALHSVSYSGGWGQDRLTLEAVIARARQLGFEGVMLMAKRPHAAPLDLDGDSRARIRGLLRDRGLELACLAGYNDFTLGIEQTAAPALEMHVG